MDNTVHDPTQRHVRSMLKGSGLRQALEPRRNPAAMVLRELFCLAQAPARRHCEHNFARGCVDAERVASRLPVATHANEIDRFVENHLNDRGFAWPSVK